MQAMRNIVTPRSENLIIRLPREFRNKRVEVIILPCQGEKEQTKRKERLLKIFNESKGVLPEGYRFNREEAHER
ncbi:hypothetical protein KJ693_00860 [bacterium]|nr:hypothetical protein [bacterium]MBU1613840.1 hypothetical protein [bacterium]